MYNNHDRIQKNIEVTDSKLLKFMENDGKDPGQDKFYIVFEYIEPYLAYFNLIRKNNPAILDIGCRGGFFFDILKEKGYTNLYGIDISEKSIDILIEKGYRGEVLDIQKCTLDKEFDVIFLIHTLEHTSSPKDVISNIYSMLDKNGLLYIEVPRREEEQRDNDSSHFIRFKSFNDLDENFNKGKWVNIKNNDDKPIRAIYEKR